MAVEKVKRLRRLVATGKHACEASGNQNVDQLMSYGDSHAGGGVVVGPFGGVVEVGSTSNSKGCSNQICPSKKRNSTRKRKCQKKQQNGERGAQNVMDQEVNQLGLGGVLMSQNQPLSLNKEDVEREGVKRNPLGVFAASSLSSNERGPIIQDVSVGDSGIVKGNNRFEENYEREVAEKMWNFAKQNLGVTIEEEDERFIERLREYEKRDQAARKKKGKKSVSK